MEKTLRNLPGSRITSCRNGIKRTLENASSRKALKKRIPLPGFPIDRHLQTQEEIDNYLSGDKIVCFLCGRWFKYIGNSHLMKIHNIDIDEYKKRYGLPYSRGICSKEYRQRKSEIGKRQYWEGKSPLADPGIRKLGCEKAAKTNRNQEYRKQPFNEKRMRKTHLSSPVAIRIIPKEFVEIIIEGCRKRNIPISQAINNVISCSAFYHWKNVYKI